MSDSRRASAAARDATNWAKPVSTLNVAEVPEGAIEPQRRGQAAREPDPGLRQDVAEDLPGAPAARDACAGRADRRPGSSASRSSGRRATTSTRRSPASRPVRSRCSTDAARQMKLSTGVMVLYADEESFTLMTPQGHMFAGWITFSATRARRRDGRQAQVLMRASDPIFELGPGDGRPPPGGPVLGATRSANVAAHFGEPEARGRRPRSCASTRKRQWSQWRNVWHSSAIRSTLYMVGAPAARGEEPVRLKQPVA